MPLSSFQFFLNFVLINLKNVFNLAESHQLQMVKATLQGGVYQINCVPTKTFLMDFMIKKQF